jgi:hypothetical protein
MTPTPQRTKAISLSLKYWLPITLVLLLAAAARILNAGHFPVFTDEGWSIWAANDPTLAVIVEKVSTDHHPPLFFTALSRWQFLVGDSHLALRYLSILAGVLSTALVYRIGKDVFDRQTGVLAALLFGVLPHAVYYGQEIRHYSWLMLSVCLMTLFFLQYLRRPRWTILIPYVLSIVFMLYTLYFGLFILTVHGLIGVFVWRGTLRQKANLIGAWVVALVLYIPWIMIILEQLNRLVGSGGIGGFPHSYATTIEGVLQSIGLLSGQQPALLVGLYLLGIWALWRARHRLESMTVALSGGGLLVLMLVLNLWVGVVSARTLVYLTPMLMVICGYGLSQIEPRTRGILAALFVAFVLLNPGVIQARLDSPAVVETLAADYSPGDLIILETGWDENALHYELMQGLPGEPTIIRTIRRAKKPLVPQFEEQMQNYDRIWMVNWLQAPQILPFLEGGGLGAHQTLSREVFVGERYDKFNDPTINLVLFERPTSDQAFHYADTFTLHDALVATNAQPGQTLHVDLWWSASQTPTLDYSGGVFLQNSAGVTQVEDNAPLGEIPTSQWAVDDWFFDRRTLTIPATIAPGEYRIWVNVYWYGDAQPLLVNGEKGAVIGKIAIAP